MPRDSVGFLGDAADRAFQRRGWHGTTLKGALRGLRTDQALWRPQPDRHNIWELILHAAYWKYIVRRRLTGRRDVSFPRSPSDWPALPERPTLAALKNDIALLQEQHDLLQLAVRGFPPARLSERAPESSWTYAEHISGIAAHDAYHCGQIQLLKKLWRDR